jgi:hypothetical protein
MTIITAKVIAASDYNGTVLWSLQLQYPRFIHSELMTHRVFSRSASSSRAIPVKKMLSQVWNEPAEPVHWGRNQPGMQANEQLTGWRLWLAQKLWRGAAKTVCGFVYVIDKLGGHKQWANRLLEPWQYIHVIVTTTEWDNFDSLRLHRDAQPEMRKLAEVIKFARGMFQAEGRIAKRGNSIAERDTWHLPYVSELERYDNTLTLADHQAMSTARCARVSYLLHDGAKPDLQKDLELYERLLNSKPEHASPAEHPARVGRNSEQFYYNLKGWTSLRWLRDNQALLPDGELE